MRAFVAQTLMTLRLTFRDRMVIFFNYAFPLVFFFMFAGLFKAERGGAMVQVLTMVLTIGILGTGFFGAGIRSVQERETGILRRFKVAPISAAPILISSMTTGLIVYLPAVLLMLLLSHVQFGMPWPQRWLSLIVYICISVVAFRAIGLIVASVVNSMQESQILVQLMYLPMLLLSGATFPLSLLPNWLQIVAQFVPSTYLITGMQGIMGRNETLLQNLPSVGALILTSILATFIAVKLFRWEKEERLPNTAKLWIIGVLAPFVILGTYQARTKDNVLKARVLDRIQSRERTRLIRNARIFVGNGKIIESGGILIRNGKIADVYEGASPDPASLKADPIEASGKTVIPGLIDVHVHLSAPGGFPSGQDLVNPDKSIPRELAAYLYSGVTAVKSVGDPLNLMVKYRRVIESAERDGTQLFFCGPMFTTQGGHGTEFFKSLPENIRRSVEAETLRLPKTPEEARRQVDELKRDGVDGIKAILESGTSGMLFNRMDVNILRAIAEQAHADKLPIVIHTGDARDVADALSVGADGIEHGSAREALPDALFVQMKQHGVTYDPTLSVMEAYQFLAGSGPDPIDRPLVQQVGPAQLLASTRQFLQSPQSALMRQQLKALDFTVARAGENLLKAWRAGVTLVTGSDAGNPLVWHGPTVQQEMDLWTKAGIPAPVALQAATFNAAQLLRATDHIGWIAKGRDATLLIIEGDPTRDIRLSANIQTVFFRGERIDRSGLFDQE